jgi:hypothetical protein
MGSTQEKTRVSRQRSEAAKATFTATWIIPDWVRSSLALSGVRLRYDREE